jgi:hypothetical protein
VCGGPSNSAAGAVTSRRRPVLDVEVIAKQLDIARHQESSRARATVYDFNRQTIETQPQGDNQPLGTSCWLQAPGVTQDCWADPRPRHHANLQYRLNGFSCRGINASASRRDAVAIPQR